jgi:hypothetical protein
MAGMITCSFKPLLWNETWCGRGMNDGVTAERWGLIPSLHKRPETGIMGSDERRR